jgi:hypothetical protein
MKLTYFYNRKPTPKPPPAPANETTTRGENPKKYERGKYTGYMWLGVIIIVTTLVVIADWIT